VRLARRGVALFVIGLLIAACGDGPTAEPKVPVEVRLLSPSTNSGTPGWPLADSVIVEVLDANGNALSGIPVRWTAENGSDRTGAAADTTNIAGRASAEWTLGRTEGEQTLTVVADDLAPVVITASATIFHAASVTVGGGFACALTETERALCWGLNNRGQLGNGTIGETRVQVPAPVAGDLTFTSLTASGAHACGLTPGGAAYCWGSNEGGEVGIGSTSLGVPTPTPVQTSVRFTQISAEGYFPASSCGLTMSGEAWCWGGNDRGTLGDGTTTNSSVPVRVVGSVAFGSLQTGYFHSCATATTGELWCWGEQDSDPGPFGASATGIHPAPVLVPQDFVFVDLVAGWNYTCGLAAQGSALCWGANWHAGLGNGGYDPSAVPVLVAGGHSFSEISAAGYKGTHGLTTDGLLYRWGTSGTVAPEPTPILVTDLRFTQLDSGEDPFNGYGAYGACGITAGNAVYCVDDDGLVHGVPAPAAP